MKELKAEDYLALISRIAISFHHTSGIDYEELYCEGCLIFSKAAHTHNPERGKFSTHLHTCVRNHFQNCMRQQWRYRHLVRVEYMPVNKEMLFKTKPTQERGVWFQEKLETLGADAREICRFIFNSPGEYYSGQRKMSCGAVWRTLEGMGWKRTRIEKGIREIKYILGETTV